MTPVQISPHPPHISSANSHQSLKEAAESLEASFLAQMLEAAGLGKPSQTFGGGAGEDQFSSLLVHEQAQAMVKSGGIGLSEVIFEALKERVDD